MAGRRLVANARRVSIKSRFVVLKKAGSKFVSTHLRYIERDGTTRDGQRGQAYSADADTVDLKSFEERGRGDRHQFRFIVSAEDAMELEDLRGFTREFMRRMAVDLETPLDWVAVDHWDTDNPHTHIVLRGRVGSERKGQDLVIAPDYMAHGMRMRASEITTEWLGPRTETEIRQSLQREVDLERLTSLDRALLRQATLEIVDLAGQPEDHQRWNVLRARLQRLEAMALAERIDANRWRLVPGMEKTLTALGERGDILRTMHRAMKGEQRELAMEASPATPIIGRIAAKGLTDELHDSGYLVVDAIDGRAHYLKLSTGFDLAALPLDGIVEYRPHGQERGVDRNIAIAAKDGVYRTADHLVHLNQASARNPQLTVNAHVRRLEALRRAGIVERLTEGVWQIPPDLKQKARQYDIRRASESTIELRSYLPIQRQVNAIGATWLDRQLVDDGRGLVAQGFGAQARDALHRRVDFLAEQSLAQRQGQRVILARNLLVTLRDRELASAGKKLQTQTSAIYRPLQDGQQVHGVYRRSIQLVSGRFAMLDDGMRFSLVPWRPVIEAKLGMDVSGVVRGGAVTWNFQRQRSPSL
ncbi:DUF3363 domain-containing protein [Variovorax sp. GB1P17]|uniref:DUF3363 domain-containing protein n=1 Tax=Variovorax sp. GB1P17 TaxID=3443740 RepID=UPI003F48DC74